MERVQSGAGKATETRRRFRLHEYTIHKYKSSAGTGANASGASASTSTGTGTGTGKAATTTISLAFPVDEELRPLRVVEGELVFAYLPVTAAGFQFAINADFELVASRQDVSDNHSGNHVLLGRIPPLFVRIPPPSCASLRAHRSSCASRSSCAPALAPAPFRVPLCASFHS